MALHTTDPRTRHVGAGTFSPEPNVRPMIDVLLALLIIFMAAIPEQRKTLAGQLPPDDPAPGAQSVATVLEVGAGARYAKSATGCRGGAVA
ncbi:MAG: biopolymer transporter ExbD [Gemmatimonadaceae bacterium]